MTPPAIDQRPAAEPPVDSDAPAAADVRRIIDRHLGDGTDGRWTSIDRDIAAVIADHDITHQDFEGGPDRLARVSASPMVIGQESWASIESGLVERVGVLEELLADLLGDQRLVRDGVIPGELLWRHPNFHRAFVGLSPAGGYRLHITAANLVRDASGGWAVLDDRTRAPSGLGYALENRLVTNQVLGELSRRCGVRRLAGFFDTLRRHLQTLAAGVVDAADTEPTIGLLTPRSERYREFDDHFLARYLGLELVTGDDLAVRNGETFLRTVGGLRRVAALWRHVGDSHCDPLTLDPASIDGLTGLVRSIRRGSVGVVNALGSTLVQTPGLLPYLDAAAAVILGGEPQLPTVRSVWCGDDSSKRRVIERPDDWVLRPAFATTPRRQPIGTDGLPDDFASHPDRYVAVRRFEPARSDIVLDAGRHSLGFVLKCFALRTDRATGVLPGGLARLDEDTDRLLRHPQAARTTQDVWVLGGFDDAVTLLSGPAPPPPVRRINDELPSRVAEQLFWLGRYVERAEGTARVVRAAIECFEGVDDAALVPERAATLIRMAAAIGQIEPAFGIADWSGDLPDPPAALVDSLSDRDATLAFSLSAASAAARRSRDRLSGDAYRIIRRATRRLAEPPAGATPTGFPHRASDRLNRRIDALLAVAGVLHENYVRGGAWPYLQIGRRVERVLLSAELLSVWVGETPNVTPNAGGCRAVLEVTDATMTYRTRNGSTYRPAAVWDLVVADADNPRSVAFADAELRRLIGSLPRAGGVVEPPPLDLGEPTGDWVTAIHRRTARWSDAVAAFVDEITRRHLTHTRSRRLHADTRTSSP